MIVIFEGPDNVGKGTQISLLYKYLANSNIIPTIIHCANFGIEDTEKSLQFSKMAYSNMFANLLLLMESNNTVVLDRSHIGEYVYGKMYRGYDPSYIWDLEKNFYNNLWFDKKQKLYYITFYDEPKNLIERDDKLSFSIDPNKKAEEVKRFIEAHNLSCIPKKLLVNISGKQPEEIFETIKLFLEI